MGTITFGNSEHGITINVDLTNGFKERLVKWLEEEHPHIYDSLQGICPSDLRLAPDDNGTFKITFNGDEGTFVLTQVDIKTV